MYSEKMDPQRAVIDVRNLEIVITDDRYKYGESDYDEQYYDLKLVSTIYIISENPDVNQRIAAANKLRQRDINRQRQDVLSNMAAGALVGGAVDMMVGDDSILDGMASGAVLYAAASLASEPVPDRYISTIRLTEGLKNFAVLVFKNGESLRYAVDPEGIAVLYQVIGKLKVMTEEAPMGSPLCSRPLCEDKVTIASQVRTSNIIAAAREKATRVLIVCIFNSIALLVLSFIEFLNESWHLHRFYWVAFAIIVMLSWCYFFWLLKVESRAVENIKIKSQLKSI
jgi:hypothetical protein